MTEMGTLLAVDGGGTRLRGRLVALERPAAPLADAETAGVRLATAGLTEVAAALECLWVQMTGPGGAPSSTGQVPAVVSVAMAGAAGQAQRDVLRGAARLVFPEARVVVATDAEAALLGAGPGSPRIILIVGTGSICVGTAERGGFLRVGGWGPLAGDEGSSYDIGRHGLRALLQSVDGRAPRGPLQAILTTSLMGPGEREGLRQKVLSLEGDVAGVAALAPLVCSAAEAGDPSAEAILRQAALDLAVHVRAVTVRIGPLSDAPAVYLSGGLIGGSRRLRELVTAEIRRTVPGARVRQAVEDAGLRGAVQLGLRRCRDGEAEPDQLDLSRRKPARITERPNAETAGLDRLDALGIVEVLNRQDQLVAPAVARISRPLALLVETVAAALDGGGRLFYVGAGTSGRLGVLDASECPPTFGTDPGQVVGIIAGGDEALRSSMEGAEDDLEAGRRCLAERDVNGRDVVVGITASGRTPFVAGALEQARAAGSATALVTCNPEAPLLPLADHPLVVVVGPEAVAGSTRLKAGTATKLVLNIITTGAMVRRGLVHGNRMIRVQPSCTKLTERWLNLVIELAGVNADRGRELFDLSSGDLEVALLMESRGIDAAEARQLLSSTPGGLRAALEAVSMAPGERDVQ